LPSRRRRIEALLVLLLLSSFGLAVLLDRYGALDNLVPAFRTTPVYHPPVLAGQMAWTVVWCSGGVYARKDDAIVLTSSDHCAAPGSIASDPDGVGVAGVWGPIAYETTCSRAGHVCGVSAMNYLIVAADRIPWGHLNEIDMGAGGYRTVTPGTKPLSCDEVTVDDPVEMDGRGLYRKGRVVEKGEYLKPVEQDPIYFPCMIAANIRVGVGDSGGVVLVRGIPSGVLARGFDGWLGFTPLDTGLAELGLTLCDTPNCGLTPP
jgi:hypothetical protein